MCEPWDSFCLESVLANCCCSYCFLQFWDGSLLQSSNVALRVMGCKGSTGNHWTLLCGENKDIGREERGRKLRSWRRPNFYEFMGCVIGHVQYSIWHVFVFNVRAVLFSLQHPNETSAHTYTMHWYGNIFSNLGRDNVPTVISQLSGDDNSHAETL